jgi:UMF1 family MFS transporter
VLGAIGCVALGFLGPGQWVGALWIYGLSYMAFNASCVFYDSLLPSLARGTEMDYASSLGYSLGYLGGGLLFLINVIWYLKPDLFGFPDGVTAVKASFMSVGVWWLVFSIPLLKNVPEPAFERSLNNLWALTLQSLKTLRLTFSHLLKDRNILTFIISYWLFIDGVYTVITMAVDYGMGLGLESKHLIMALLITQFIGFPFAWLFGLITPRFGCRKPILFCIFIYALTVILATFMSTAWHFYALAAVIGMVQGGVQSLTRSLFGNMVPPEKSGEYFAFFNLVGKFASIMGPLLVGLTVLMTGSPRFGMMGLLVLFILGGLLLGRVKEPRF